MKYTTLQNSEYIKCSHIYNCILLSRLNILSTILSKAKIEIHKKGLKRKCNCFPDFQNGKTELHFICIIVRHCLGSFYMI